MFQFPGFAPQTYLFSLRLPAHGRQGCPIRISSDYRLCSSSPKLFAATYVLHRLLTPRHPPCALSSLTSISLPKDAYFTRKPASAGRVSLSRLSKNMRTRNVHRADLWSALSKFPADRCSSGGCRDRTDDLRLAKASLSQLS